MIRLAVADMDSPSYFVATAAVELGFFKEEGVDAEYALDVHDPGEALLDGRIDFYGGPTFGPARVFPNWRGIKLLGALSQYGYWFLALRSDLNATRGDVNAVKGLRIAAAMAGPGLALKQLLIDSGIDLERDNVRLFQGPGRVGEKGWLGTSGIRAIQDGTADGYWGNGMRIELGVRSGIATLHLDVRRGDGPPQARLYTFPALIATDRLIDEQPGVAAAAVRAIVKTQKALRADPSRATEVGRRLFPPDEAELIAELIARDAPFYDAIITQEAIDGLNRFSQAIGFTSEDVPYDRLVATQFRNLWQG